MPKLPLPPNFPLPPIRELIPLFSDVRNDLLARITEPSNDDYVNDVSDNFDHNFGTFDDFGVKNYQKVSHKMIFMSRYRGELHGEKGSTNSGRGVPPNARKKTLFYRRCSLIVMVYLYKPGPQLN